MMFGLDKVIYNALDVVTDLFDGEIDKRKVAKLIADGVSIWAVAEMFNVGVDVIEDLIEDR